jgi:zinc protease
MTLDDVNRVIRENLRMDNMQYVFITRDGEDLRDRLMSDQASPMTYDAELPQDVLDEDRMIDSIPLSFDSVEVVSAEDVFK